LVKYATPPNPALAPFVLTVVPGTTVQPVVPVCCATLHAADVVELPPIAATRRLPAAGGRPYCPATVVALTRVPTPIETRHGPVTEIA